MGTTEELLRHDLRDACNASATALAKCNKLQERLNKSSDAYDKLRREHERLAKDLIGLGTGVDLTRDELLALVMAIGPKPASPNSDIATAYTKLHRAFQEIERRS